MKSDWRSNNQGNTLITVLLFAVLAFLGLAFTLSKINFFNRTVAESEMNANLSDTDKLRFWILQKKFHTTTDQNENVKLPEWYPDPYPISSEMEKTSKVLPKVAIVSSGNEPSYVGTLFVRGKKDSTTKLCSALSSPVCKKPPASQDDCNILNFNLDGVGLGALETVSDLASTEGVQNACLAVPSLGLLTPEQKDAIFSPSFNLPLNTALESVAVSFKKYIADDSSRPNVLTKMVVKVGETIGTIAIDPPPAPKACTLTLKSPIEPIDVSTSSKTLTFDLSVDGIAEGVTLAALGSDGATFKSSDFERQSLKNYGQLKSLRSSGFQMTLSSTAGEVINPANSQEFLRTVTATVDAFSGEGASCGVQVRVKKYSTPTAVPPGWSPMAPLEKGDDIYSSRRIFTGDSLIIWPVPVFDFALQNSCYLGWKLEPPSNVGKIYDPATDAWKIMSTVNAPSKRYASSLVWTGSKMIAWGGYVVTGDYLKSHSCKYSGSIDLRKVGSYLGDGGIYDPATDSWSSMSNRNAPTARGGHVSVWTGTKMLVWGGQTTWNRIYLGSESDTNTGGLYDPAADSWTRMSTLNAPSLRLNPHVEWTGEELIVWGGCRGYSVSAYDCKTDGAIYNPATNNWRKMSSVNAPSMRNGSRSVWTGTHLIVWGGYYENSMKTSLSTLSERVYYNDGYAYDPKTDSWSSIPRGPNTPSKRSSSVVAWTGSKMIVWGGEKTYYISGSSRQDFFQDGALYDPKTQTWEPMDNKNAPKLCFRSSIYGTWTGQSMLVPSKGMKYTPPK